MKSKIKRHYVIIKVTSVSGDGEIIGGDNERIGIQFQSKKLIGLEIESTWVCLIRTDVSPFQILEVTCPKTYPTAAETAELEKMLGLSKQNLVIVAK